MSTEPSRAGWRLATAALVFAWWASAFADEGPRAVKRIAAVDANSTCIGNPVTPECALDTWMGCWSRRDKALCDAVGYWQERVDEGEPARVVEYSIEKVVVVDAQTISRADPEIADVLWFRPPVHRFYVMWRFCKDAHVPCSRWAPEEEGWRTNEFYVVRGAGGWDLRARVDVDPWYPEDKLPVTGIILVGCPYYESVYEPCD